MTGLRDFPDSFKEAALGLVTHDANLPDGIPQEKCIYGEIAQWCAEIKLVGQGMVAGDVPSNSHAGLTSRHIS